MTTIAMLWEAWGLNPSLSGSLLAKEEAATVDESSPLAVPTRG